MAVDGTTKLQALIVEYKLVWKHQHANFEMQKHTTDFHMVSTALLISAISIGIGLFDIQFSTTLLLSIGFVALVWGIIILFMLEKMGFDLMTNFYIISSLRKRISTNSGDALEAETKMFLGLPKIVNPYSVWNNRVFVVITTSTLVVLICGFLAFMDPVFAMSLHVQIVVSLGVWFLSILTMIICFIYRAIRLLASRYDELKAYAAAISSEESKALHTDATRDKTTITKISFRVLVIVSVSLVFPLTNLLLAVPFYVSLPILLLFFLLFILTGIFWRMATSLPLPMS